MFKHLVVGLSSLVSPADYQANVEVVIQSPQDPAGDMQSKEVVVTGRGATEEEAKKSARSQALDSAVGALVDAETRIAKGELIENLITASAGFIEKFEVVDRGKTKDGSAFVRAKVQVKTHLLKERLVLEKVLQSKVEGASLFAEALTKGESIEGTCRFLAKNLADYPLRAMSTALAGKPEILDRSEDVWVVGIKVDVKLDEKGWASATQTMREALKVCGRDRFQWNLEVMDPRMNPDWLETPKVGEWAQLALPGALTSYRQTYDIPKDHCIVAIPSRPEWKSAMESWVVPRAFMVEFARLSARKITLEITLKSSESQILRSFRLPMNVGPNPGITNNWACSEDANASGWMSHSASREWLSTGGDYSPKAISEAGFFDPRGLCDDLNGQIVFVPPGLPLSSARYAKVQRFRIALDVPKSEVEATTSVELKLTSESVAIPYRHWKRSDAAGEVILLRGDGREETK